MSDDVPLRLARTEVDVISNYSKLAFGVTRTTSNDVYNSSLRTSVKTEGSKNG